MHESIEGESIEDDALFGSGLGWYRHSLVEQPLECCGNHAEASHTLDGAMEQASQKVEENNAELPSDISQSRMVTRHRNTPSIIQPWTSGEASAAMESREPVVRNKTTKNKENKMKNINQKKQNSVMNENTHRIIEREGSGESQPFQPVLRYKKHDIEPVEKRTKNSIKEKKQSQNSSIAQGRSENQPHVNGVYSSLVANGINPSENPQNVSKIYVKQPHSVHNPSQRTNKVDSGEYSLSETLDSEDNETEMKVIDNSAFPQIKNDLWGMKKKENNQVSLPSLHVPAPSLNCLSFSNDQDDLEMDDVPNRSPAVVPTSSESLCPNSMQNPNVIQVPIVSQYDDVNGMYQNNQRGASIGLDNSCLALSFNGSEQDSQHVIQDESLLNSLGMPSNLPSSLLFGGGDNDRVYAQQLQRRFDREELASRGVDIGPDEFYSPYNSCQDDLHNEPSDEAEENTADHVPVVSVERIYNDLYEPEEDFSCRHIHIPLVMESRTEHPESIPSNNIALPCPDVVQMRGDHRLGDQHFFEEEPYMAGQSYQITEDSFPSYGMQEAISIHGRDSLARGSGGQELNTTMDDEIFARMLQEQLNMEDIGRPDIDQDEVYARHLQQMEDDHRYRPRGMRDRGTHQPLHTRYGHTWSRPLRVGTGSGENVFDSRPRGHGTWDRPLRRGSSGHSGQEFAFLDNIRTLPEREGYDIPPGGDLYRYEYDPDFMLDDHEDYLVSMSRDPRMLASLLMERAPDMLVPNNVDLNDYEALWELAEGLGEVRRVGMEQEEISLLPVHTYQPSPNPDSESSKTDCLVCMSTFSQGEQLRTLPCCHIYHVECIDEWLKRNAICPVCRQSAKQGEH